MLKRRLLQPLLTIVATALLGGLLGATLVRLAPGSGISQDELNFQLSVESKEYFRALHAREQHVFTFYGYYLAALGKGDLGYSLLFQRPVRELLKERLPVTASGISLGVLVGWALGFLFALPASLRSSTAYSSFSTVLSGAFLCIPSAVLALLFLVFRWPVQLAIALIVFPNVFRYLRNLLVKTYRMPYVVGAKARGLNGARIFLSHVLPNIAVPLIALAGISISIALGAAIPVEVVTDTPGIGQLAWRAALGRDVPLLVSVTLLIAVVTVTANSFSDLMAPVRTGDLR
jgi:peptide/nickel transport system permease protein